MQAATHNWSAQIGVSGDVQSADVVHCAATQVPIGSQALPASHGVMPSSPKLVHCSGLEQHEFGLCLVHAMDIASALAMRILNMHMVSTYPARSCAKS